MKFVHPEILWALSAISIPIIVHLFNFRKFKKVLFSNVAFLQEIQQETKSKSKLKHLLILASRILAITCLVFAFAQPIFPIEGLVASQGDKAVSIYIDNSFSMDSKGEVGTLLEISKKNAIELVEAHSSTDKFQILSNEFEGAQQRLISQDEAIAAIQKIEHTPSVRKLSEVYTRQVELLERAPQSNKIAFYLSDLQRNIADISAINEDTLVSWNMVPTYAQLSNNIAIDSAWFSSPLHQVNQPDELHIRLKNFGNDSKENVSLSVNVNGFQKGVTTVDLQPNSTIETELIITNNNVGVNAAEIKIDDYPITFDDTYYFSFNVTPSINMLEIRGTEIESSPIETLFEGDTYFKLTVQPDRNIEYSQFSQNNMIVLNGLEKISTGLKVELTKFVSSGGSLAIFPSENLDLQSYNDFLNPLSVPAYQGKMDFSGNPALETSTINYENELLRGVLKSSKNSNEKIDLPKTNRYFKIASGTSNNGTNILALQNGDPFFTATNFDGGKVYTSAVSVNRQSSSFTNHSFFPTLLIRAAELSINDLQLAYFLEKEQNILLRNVSLSGDQTFKLKQDQNAEEIIPEHRNNGGNTNLFIHNELSKAGQYNLLLADSMVSVLSFNFSRKESNTETYDIETVREQITESGLKSVRVIESSSNSIGKFAEEIDSSKKFWMTMIIWTLIFLAIEILLIKFFGSKKQPA